MYVRILRIHSIVYAGCYNKTKFPSDMLLDNPLKKKLHINYSERI